ncbi:hypothetical protein B7486_45755 [cyanobacterium TDX16]|nr:hypothetical protein B7486_45755 [cyanobacterium TDX16]
MVVRILLSEVRKRKKLSQNGLARLMDMTVGNIQKIETGKAKSIPIETIDKICKILECQPGDLLIYVPGDEESEGDTND